MKDTWNISLIKLPQIINKNNTIPNSLQISLQKTDLSQQIIPHFSVARLELTIKSSSIPIPNLFLNNFRNSMVITNYTYWKFLAHCSTGVHTKNDISQKITRSQTESLEEKTFTQIHNQIQLTITICSNCCKFSIKRTKPDILKNQRPANLTIKLRWLTTYECNGQIPHWSSGKHIPQGSGSSQPWKPTILPHSSSNISFSCCFFIALKSLNKFLPHIYWKRYH